MQKTFQTGAVFGFTVYLQSWKLECFVALLLPYFVERIYRIPIKGFVASLLHRITESATPKQARSNRAYSHFTAYPDPTEKNTHRPEANHLIVKYPEDKHRFTAYPDHFFISNHRFTTIRHKKTKLGIGNQFLPSSHQERSGLILRL